MNYRATWYTYLATDDSGRPTRCTSSPFEVHAGAVAASAALLQGARADAQTVALPPVRTPC